MDLNTVEFTITLIGIGISIAFLISGLISFAQYQQAGKNK